MRKRIVHLADIKKNKIRTKLKAINYKSWSLFFYLLCKGVEVMLNEKLEKLKQEQYVVEKKLTVAKHKEKQLQSELKRLSRSERTHRLCTRAGMLETFLKEPTMLTDDDVMELLIFIFHSEAVQQKLDMLIENRKKMIEMEVANTLSFR